MNMGSQGPRGQRVEAWLQSGLLLACSDESSFRIHRRVFRS